MNIERIQKLLADRRNLVLAVFLVLALSITWSTVNQIDVNNGLEREAQELQAEIDLLELQNRTRELENEFLKTEYAQDLAARDQLGYVAEGESVILIPQTKIDSQVAAYEQFTGPESAAAVEQPEQLSNLEAWVRFFSGGPN